MLKNDLRPSEYHHDNPFNFDTPKAVNLQIALQDDDPIKAAEVKAASKGGYVKSFEAAAYDLGLTALTEAVHKEKFENDPLYAKQFKANQEEKAKALLAKWDKEAADSRERRTGKREIDQTPNFGGGWQGKSLKRQWEYDQSFKDS